MNEYTRVKICGVTSAADALMAAKAGADLLGLNFFADSPRYLTAERASDICTRLREALGEQCPVLVGVFVNEPATRIAGICAQVGLDCAQLSGDEAPEALQAQELRDTSAFKALRPRSEAEALADAGRFTQNRSADARLPALLLDAWHPKLYGGSGEQASESVARALLKQVPRLMLAGGLNADNVGERVRSLRPWGVDVASGVEGTAGVKDADKVRAFIAAARGQS